MVVVTAADTDAIQLWIIGAGPAGLALAAACVERGVRVGLLAPDPRASWHPNYAMWLDDAVSLGVEPYLGHRWIGARARFAAGSRDLDRGYGLLDDRRWQLELLAQVEGAGGSIVAGTLAAIEHDDNGVVLRCEGGERLRGQLVVDATGHGSRFVELEQGPRPAHQVAWGEQWVIEAGPGEPGLDLDRVNFMDWSSTGDAESDESLPPTFSYALPLARDRLFVEETVLAARLEHPPPSYFPALRERQRRRLELQGVRCVGEPVAVERCVIPMGAALPRGDQRTLAYGGAASMVHPATGYLLTNVLRRRARVADAIAAELERWVSPGGPSRRIWQAIWSPAEVRAWRLYGFGLEVICALDRPGVDRFFAAFFELPDHCWRGFVSGSAPTPELMVTMLRYFAGVPAPIRARLTAALFGREGLRLLRGLGGLQRS
ncbi:Lycopene beta cyclase [Enhygromyxa salina]|uniref:Lycopene beta cyclase n=1 Tax=Enhygromyxa salina TaxID=215803 RepID=A0A0C1ZXK5_9BACT|nr:lycopene cyclase family protein [Enhygromyxa salina]KIG15888.1 Lycopene beta cyclase [Enhygromyxa salina]